ncbi:hypothetical protein SEUCBS139899_006312 [Sporothrix eucalyptigena]|uniref:Biotrophy-associated secreted protein 2 n=1 Tax=Sporothrix eucalyptigena TaxID=1812306 RepID=A0ABP0CQJ6_9PEZI
MARSFAALMAYAAIAMAIPGPITPDPNGAKNVGNGQGLQFITGGCLSTADCSQAVVQSCCAFIAGGASTGICSGIDVGNVNGKAGCGFGDGGSATTTASTSTASVATTSSSTDATSDQCTVDTSLAGSQSVGLGNAQQFITGQCFSAADCASGCCVEQTSGPALCKAQIVTEEAGLTCDFSCSGSTTTSTTSTNTSSSSDVVSSSAADTAATTSDESTGTCTVDTSLAGSQNVGTGSGTQFITGQCFSPADCASGCCVLQSDGISLCKAELVTTQAGLSCDSTCSGSSTSSSSSTTSSSNAGTTTAAAVTGAAGSAQCTVDSSLAGSQNVGTGAGTQFITGQCFSSADCASGCCVEQASGAALCKAELVTTQAGLSCDFTCSA